MNTERPSTTLLPAGCAAASVSDELNEAIGKLARAGLLPRFLLEPRFLAAQLYRRHSLALTFDRRARLRERDGGGPRYCQGLSFKPEIRRWRHGGRASSIVRRQSRSLCVPDPRHPASLSGVLLRF